VLAAAGEKLSWDWLHFRTGDLGCLTEAGEQLLLVLLCLLPPLPLP
jgi:hypothetical protein